MHLVEILLPLRDNEGNPFPRAHFAKVRAELVERFGGVTAHLQAPAQGIWKDEEAGTVDRDEIVVIEVMAESLERDWWKGYREELRRRFRQEELVVRAMEIERL
jgi:hypothetical protein